MRPILGIAVLGLMASQVWAGPFQAAQVSDSATWVVHADLEALKTTEVGRFVWDKLNTGDAANKFAACAAVFGFDAREALTTLTLYGKAKAPEASVLLAEGRFNAAQLTTLLQANSTCTEQIYGGHTILSWIDGEKPREGRQFGCFHTPGRVVMSRGEAMLKEALDVLDGKHASLDAQNAFGATLPVQAPFFMAGVDMASSMALNPRAQMFKQARAGQMMLAEQNGMLVASAQLLAGDTNAARNIQSVAEGMRALAQMGEARNLSLAVLAEDTRISREGNVVRLDLRCPAQDIITMIEEDMARRAQACAGATPAPVAP